MGENRVTDENADEGRGSDEGWVGDMFSLLNS